ncbi:MAG: 2-C-methyl-D-erythritol 4-phosphate cytidylyltransferase [Bacteroidales bacterium]|nr:2-C-methyl-D-erythritol 4-phosphate cytidylyltransferase [Bacteroidales bacterium]
MDRKKFLIVVAAGSGTRMGGTLPKQFLKLDGKTVLQRSIEAFTRAVPGIRVVTVLAPEMMAYWKECCYNDRFYCPQALVGGGLTRFHSIQNALGRVPEDALVAVHDGVRPLVSAGLIQRLFDIAEQYEGVIPCLPVSDTLRVLSPLSDATDAATPAVNFGEGTLLRYDAAAPALVARERLFSVQTPQIFDAKLLRAAYSLPYETSFTDDGSVVEKFLAAHPERKEAVAYVPGEKTNIKLTTPEDLTLAEAILSLK